jgi:FkbM family methyltransferase
MKALLKRLLSFLSGLTGYSIWNTAFINQRLNRPELSGLLSQLRSAGFMPNTIFDVGVADGTPALVRVYPDVRQILFEPLTEYTDDLNRLMAEYPKLELVQAAAGTSVGTLTLNVPKELDSASLYTEASLRTEPRTIPVTTLDVIAKERQAQPPFLIKADVEGAELDVLKGSEAVLKQTGAVILETSLMRFRENAPIITEIISFMTERGFVIYDLGGQAYRPLDGALARVDVVFVPANSPLIRDQRFSTDEQRAQREKKFERFQ